MNLNTKQIYIDCDGASIISAPLNPVPINLNLTKGSTYILQANTYADSWTNTVSTFTPYDAFALYIGDQYQGNVAPVITITDPSMFNNVSDWSLSNVYSGNLSVRVNVSSTELTTDLANNDSKSYTMQFVLTNNVAGKVILSSSNVSINNVVE